MGLCINLINFAHVNPVVLGAFTTILGGWVVRKDKNKDQLSPAEAEIRAELGKSSAVQQLLSCTTAAQLL